MIINHRSSRSIKRTRPPNPVIMSIKINLNIIDPLPVHIRAKNAKKKSFLNLPLIKKSEKTRFSKSMDMLRKVGLLIIGISIKQGVLPHIQMMRVSVQNSEIHSQTKSKARDGFKKPGRMMSRAIFPRVPIWIFKLKHIHPDFIITI